MKHTSATFQSSRVSLDNEEFEKCKFKGCTLVYSGGQPPTLNGCSFDMCSWVFEGPASDTMHFVLGLYRDPGLRKVVEDTLKQGSLSNGPGGGFRAS